LWVQLNCKISVLYYESYFLYYPTGESNKIISDHKYKLQKAEQEIANLQSSLARSETQVIRYKSTAEAAEKAEAELKVERRKLQREVSWKMFIKIFIGIYLMCF